MQSFVQQYVCLLYFHITDRVYCLIQYKGHCWNVFSCPSSLEACLTAALTSAAVPEPAAKYSENMAFVMYYFPSDFETILRLGIEDCTGSSKRRHDYQN
jgi:hypothetical protein